MLLHIRRIAYTVPVNGMHYILYNKQSQGIDLNNVVVSDISLRVL